MNQENLDHLEKKRESEFRRVIRLIQRSPLVILALVMISLLLLIAVLAPWIAPYDPEVRDWRNRLDPPSLDHLFGTDHTGADVLSKVIFGARTTLLLAVSIVGSALTIGTLLGLISAYFGGMADMFIMRAADVFLALPAMILAIAIIVMLGSGIQNVAVAIIIVRWTPYARLARSQGLAVKETQYVEAAQAIGASPMRIILRHMLPNIMGSSIVYATMDLGSVVLLAASLSFLGLGAGPGAAEWGRMISEGRSFFFQSPWIVGAAGGAILVAVLSFSLLGDGLRDVFDPRTRHGS